MLAPFLCSLSGIIYISIDLYLEYVKKNCFTTANNLKELCFFHLNSNRASTLYSKQETESLSKEIIINIDAYINIIKEASSISTQLNIQNINDKCKKNMIKLFKIADDLNYITLQTSAHNIEIIVIYLVIPVPDVLTGVVTTTSSPLTCTCTPFTNTLSTLSVFKNSVTCIYPDT